VEPKWESKGGKQAANGGPWSPFAPLAPTLINTYKQDTIKE